MSAGRMFKYQISDSDMMQADVLMREGAVIRAVAMQGKAICAWAEVPYDVGGEKLESRTFCVVPTGGDLPEPGTYLATIFEGPFVWHVYELTV